ncbi:MAG: division/cell wall cluster transcriptional repressor MraZ [Firmicutes bacterium]|nr:division/cell wall cluster transcriptional repressor MraZ [Bacillota bacterium]
MFSGTYHHNIDSKGRIIIPARFREELGSNFVLTKGLDNCLFVFPEKEWFNFRDKLKAVPVSSKEGRAFTRYFFSSAVECDIDKQGRLNIPSVLRDHAKIDREVVTIGVDNRIEIWSGAEWESYNMSPELDSELIAEKMESLGI